MRRRPTANPLTGVRSRNTAITSRSVGRSAGSLGGGEQSERVGLPSKLFLKPKKGKYFDPLTGMGGYLISSNVRFTSLPPPVAVRARPSARDGAVAAGRNTLTPLHPLTLLLRKALVQSPGFGSEPLHAHCLLAMDAPEAVDQWTEDWCPLVCAKLRASLRDSSDGCQYSLFR